MLASLAPVTSSISVLLSSSRTARRSVSVRLDLIDSVARSLSMLLAVPDRAYSCLIAADYVLFCLVLLSKCVSAVVRLLAGSRCLADCIAHPNLCRECSQVAAMLVPSPSFECIAYRLLACVLCSGDCDPCIRPMAIQLAYGMCTLHLPAYAVHESLFLLPH